MVINEGPDIFSLYCILSNCNMELETLSGTFIHLTILCDCVTNLFENICIHIFFVQILPMLVLRKGTLSYSTYSGIPDLA